MANFYGSGIGFGGGGVAGFVSGHSATGGTITTVDTDYKVHTFTSGGTFEITSLGDPAVVELLIVAGGGASGWGNFTSGYSDEKGAGGGAGGYRHWLEFPVTATTYTVVIGAGGTETGTYQSTPGEDSSFGSTDASGGGQGGLSRYGPYGAAGGGSGSVHGGYEGNPGGSGGGAGGTGSDPPDPIPNPGGPGNLGSYDPVEGYDGGDGGPDPHAGEAGGGGGSSAAGADAVTSGGGGAGTANTISGASVTYASGGNINTSPYDQPDNTGHGGNGMMNVNDSGHGGSGIVIVRFRFQ